MIEAEELCVLDDDKIEETTVDVIVVNIEQY